MGDGSTMRMPEAPKKSKYRGRAILSACGRYRYRLSRDLPRTIHGMADRRVGFVMLNPSTADHELDDNTIRKICGYAIRWGYDGVDAANLFAWRSVDPANLYTHARNGTDIIGPDNDAQLEQFVIDVDMVVCAWGAHGGDARLPIRREQPGVAALPATVVTRGEYVRRALENARIMHGKPELHYLALTDAGVPRHPLYLKNDLTPTPWK